MPKRLFSLKNWAFNTARIFAIFYFCIGCILPFVLQYENEAGAVFAYTFLVWVGGLATGALAYVVVRVIRGPGGMATTLMPAVANDGETLSVKARSKFYEDRKSPTTKHLEHIDSLYLSGQLTDDERNVARDTIIRSA